MRKRIYRIHNLLSLIISVPVALWAISGFMHPVMTNIRPAVVTQSLPSFAVDTAQIKVSLEQCLLSNGIDSISNVHIVHMGGQQFYQVLVDNDRLDIRYFSTVTGKLLEKGDELYARVLARAFLEGSDSTNSVMSNMGGDLSAAAHDCCLRASFSVMGSAGAGIRDVLRVDHFDGEYKYINHLLPVYRVSFNRSDNIRVYVETSSGRFAYAVDDKRAVFDRFFGIFHTWEWMNGMGNTKYVLMVGLTLMAFLTTLLGLYLFIITKSKKGQHAVVRARRNHRYVSLIASLFTLMFTFSGGYHAFYKLRTGTSNDDTKSQRISSASIDLKFSRFISLSGGREIRNISLCMNAESYYWRIVLRNAGNLRAHTDLMKQMSVAKEEVIYVKGSDFSILNRGDEWYARKMAGYFSRLPDFSIRAAELVTSFTEEYGFINKRLPVWKVQYANKENERYYLETSTGTLAAHIQDKDLIDGYSFAFLHKHHFMDWAGKSVRDFSTMFWAAMQVAMIIVGLILYFRFVWRRKKMKAGA
jgi:hypothetical protein